MFPLVAISKRPSCSSMSTPEAELVAGSHGLLREMVPAFDMCDKGLPHEYEAVLHDDNNAMMMTTNKYERACSFLPLAQATIALRTSWPAVTYIEG